MFVLVVRVVGARHVGTCCEPARGASASAHSVCGAPDAPDARDSNSFL